MPVRPAWSADSSLVSASEAMRRWTADRARPRILLVARWPVAGIRTHLRGNYLALCRAGFRFSFVGPDDDSLAHLRADFDGQADVEFVGAPVEQRRCRLWPVVRGLLREGRFGLLHSHGITAAVHATLANLGIAVPHVVTLHEPLRDNQFPGWLGGLKRWTLTRALQQADAIITTSEDARANLLEHVPSLRRQAERLLTVPNGLPEGDETSPAGGSVELRRHLGLEESTRLCGFSAGCSSLESFAVVLEAIEWLVRRPLPRAFHLAGFGCGALRRRYQTIILRRGLEQWLSLLDGPASTPTIVRQLDLLVLPSSEGSARLAMEALAAGVPIVGCDGLGLRELLAGTPARRVAPNDPAALAEALFAALDEPGIDAAQAFAPLARARFDNEHSVRRLMALLEALALGATSTFVSQPLAA